MKSLPFWQVDAFTSKPFSGNPAAVFPLSQSISDELMQAIASEMNLSETAFLLIEPQKPMLLRWFTPKKEIDLCGHATLAAAHIYFSEISKKQKEVIFQTKTAGPLTVTKNKNLLSMDFPLRAGKNINLDSIPPFVLDSISPTKPKEAFLSRDLMLVYDDENTILEMKPNFNQLSDFSKFVIVTAPSSKPQYDFVSRFFCGKQGILEDPVTGSAHCTLGPYWSKKLNKHSLKARQVSQRGGDLELLLKDDRINILGEAITTIEGTFRI